MELPENYFLDSKQDYQNYLLKRFFQESVNYIITVYIIHGLFPELTIEDLETALIVVMAMEHLFKQLNHHTPDGKLRGTN